MGVLDWLPGVDTDDSPESDTAAYRCLRCQAFHDRAHHSCPDCGSRFVAPIDPDDESVPDPGPDDSDEVRRLPEDSEWKFG